MTGGMMFKGTPGPWDVAIPIGATSTVPRPIAFIVGPVMVVHGDGKSLGYKLEDAHLIAAAPELLEALKNIVEDLEMRSKNGVVDCSHGIYCDARQAIAKALGEQK